MEPQFSRREPQFSRRRIQGDELVVTFTGVSREVFYCSGLYVDGAFRWRVGLCRRQGTLVIGVSCLNVASAEMVLVHLQLLDQRRSPPVAQKTEYGLVYPERPCSFQLGPVGTLQAQGLIHRDSISFCFGGCRLQLPQFTLGLDLGRLLQSGEGADVIFNVGEEEFPAHRSVVLARSPVLSAHVLAEGEESQVRIDSAIDPKIFRGFLKYLYTDQLPRVEEIIESGASKQERLLVLQRLFFLADKFGMDKMKHLLEEKMMSELDISTGAAILTFAQEHSRRKLLEDCCRAIVSKGWLHDVIQSESFSDLKTGDYPARAIDSLLLEAGRALKRPRIV